jgi:hypothetical protein
MPRLLSLWAVAAALLCALPVSAASLSEANQLFADGRLADALDAYEGIPSDSPDIAVSLRRQGAIHLYANRWAQAEAKFLTALAIDPNDAKAASLLGELETRRDNFAKAAAWFVKAGRAERAEALQAFGAARPYRIVSAPVVGEVAFVQTDPLPAVRATVNGKSGLFLIDTGAGEIVLDPDFAKSAGIEAFGGTQGTFAGGKTASVQSGRVSRFRLGGLELADLPVSIVSTKAFAAATDGKPVAGVIGTALLYHFRATLDYPRGRLLLQRQGTSSSSQPAVAEIPFWLAGDHYMLVAGEFDGGASQLFFVDTGLAGFAFTAPGSTLAGARISLPTPAQATDGGVGSSAATPFDVKSLKLGALTQENLQGLYGPFPPSLENGLGIHIGGIVSHAFFRPYAITFDFARMVIEIRQGS